MTRLRQQPRKRALTEEDREAKLQRILDAALDEFVEKGFAAARLDDVAARAGIAKGTIYLYVPSKEALFETLIRSAIVGPIEAIEAKVAALDPPAEAVLRMLFAFIRQEVLATRRKDIARLVLSEAGRFPELAAFYHREVISRGLDLLRRVTERAVERGEFRSDELARFPQLAIAPALVAILWTSLFDRFDPLDAEGMLDAHIDLLMRALKSGPAGGPP
jgi:AcrR family transcriptional regulator